MTKIKICGLTSMDDIMAVNAWKPDYAGFVFAPGKRRISPETAAAFKKVLVPEIQAVGVFVNEGAGMVAELANQGVIDLIQLHGDETPADVRALKAMTNAPIIKAIRVRTMEDIRSALAFPSDYLLFDTYTRDAYGGSGLTFDWSMIPAMNRPYFLAGGLTPDNIKDAVRTTACCLDISSGVETGGRKDRMKIKQVIETVRRE